MPDAPEQGARAATLAVAVRGLSLPSPRIGIGPYGQFSNQESLNLEFGSNEFLHEGGGFS